MRSRMLSALLLTGSLFLVACEDNKTDSAADTSVKAERVSSIPPAPEPYIPPAGATATPEPLITMTEPAPAPKAGKAPKAAAAQGKTYTVQKGDTLIGIAKKVYGDAKKYKDIAAANNISDYNKIKAGQVLALP